MRSSSPIWIFSLNHDLILELLAHHSGIPIRDSFWPDKVLTIPYVEANGHNMSPITANILSEEDLNGGRFRFFCANEAGINLIKIHGGLNIFAFRDGHDLCRLCPRDDEIDGSLRTLTVVNDEIGARFLKTGVHAINEIIYNDETGTVNFLQRTLLAGAHKFDEAYHQTLPHKMLDICRSYIGQVQKLYTIGYSFSDTHVDEVLRKWLETSAERQMIIVNPKITGLPPYFAHLALQIDVQRLTASKFFAQYRQAPMTGIQRAEQYLREKLRPRAERKAARKW